MASFQHPELNKLALDLGLMAKRAPEDAKEITEEFIGRVSDTQRDLVPKDTMATHDSISDETYVKDGTVHGESGPTTRQAIFQEWGTVEHPPQAFAGPALDRHSADYEEAIAEIPVRYW